MSLRRRRAAAPSVACLALALVACGGGPPPAAPTGVATKPVATPTAAVDTSPVPEPDGLLLVARVAKPENVARTVGAWTRLPLPSGADLVRSFDDAVGDAVDLSQPVDGAVTVSGRASDPRVLVAFAVAVRSFDDARAKLSARHRLTEGKNGALWVEGIGGRPAPSRERSESDDDDDGGETCQLAHGNGGDRLVCGEREAVDALAPYLSRTMPKQTWTTDLHVEIRTVPLRQYATQVRALVPLVTRSVIGSASGALHELLDAAAGEVVDFVGDTDRMTLDAQLADSGVDATMRVDYQRAWSLVARAGVAHPERADAPPASFFHLPADTDLAFYSRGSDPKLFDRPRELIGKALDEVTSAGQMPEPERKAVRELVVDKMMSLLGGPVVYGKGFDSPALDKALAVRRSAKAGDVLADAETKRVMAEQLVGWHLVQVGEPVAKVGAMLKDWSGLWNRPAFARWAKTRASAKVLAQMRIAGAPAGVALPKDTVHLEIVFPVPDVEVPTPAPGMGKGMIPVKAIPQKPIVFHVLAVPDGGATWIGLGLDGKLLAQKAAVSLASAPEKDTLGKSAAGDAFRGAKTNAGAMVTLRGLAVITALEEGRRSPYGMLGSLADKGTTPMVLSFVAQGPSASAQAGTATGTFKVPRAVIEDVARMLLGARSP